MKRDTRQRDAIRNALIKAGRPLSVDEILGLAKNEVTSLGIATVYRNLKALQLEGCIAQIDLPGQPPRWEMSLKCHHHYFLCRTCDRLLEIDECLDGITRLLPEGYTLDDHYILLRGQCDVCTRKKD